MSDDLHAVHVLLGMTDLRPAWLGGDRPNEWADA